MKKRLFSMLLVVALTMGALPTFTVAASAASADKWDGTSVDTSWHNSTDTAFTIDTAAELAGLAAIVNGKTDDFSGDTIMLGADIDLGGKLWTPIGSGSSACFKGAFDGDFHAVSGLKIESSGRYVGMFGYISGGAVILCANTGSITGNTAASTSSNYAGGIAGKFYSSSTVKNTHNYGTVTGTKAYPIAPGGTAVNCYYLAESETDKLNGTEYKTAAEFKDGTVLDLLNGGNTGTDIRRQQRKDCFHTGHICRCGAPDCHMRIQKECERHIHSI